MSIIISEASTCTACPLSRGRTQVVLPSGDPNSKILFIGEAPGRDEDREGRPFVGAAGVVLNRLLTQVGINRDSILITNLIMCRPPNNRSPHKGEVEACSMWLSQVIDTVRPEVIVLLGASPLALFFPEYKVSQVSGRFLEKGGQRFLALYHPAAVLHNPELMSKLNEDYEQLKYMDRKVSVSREGLRWKGGYFYLGSGSGLFREYRCVSIDIETTSLVSRKILGIGVGTEDGAFYFPAGNLQQPLSIIENPDRKKIYHNSLFDLDVLHNYCTPDTSNFCDTLALANLLGLPRSLYQLGAVVGQQSGELSLLKIDRGEVTGSTEDVALKCCLDCIATLKAYNELVYKVHQPSLEVDLNIVPILIKMSRRGIKLDQRMVEDLTSQLQGDLRLYKEIIQNRWGINPGSSKQLGKLLSKLGFFLPKSKSKTRLAVDDTVLEKINHPIANLVKQYRRAQKGLSTYIKPLQGSDRVYSRFHLNAITGRISSTKIDNVASLNLQNIPGKKSVEQGISQYNLRAPLVPDKDFFFDADASQIELRIMAYMSDDKVMQEVFERGGDIHRTTAAAIYSVAEDAVSDAARADGKKFNFAVPYGLTDESLEEKFPGRDVTILKEQRKALSSKYYRLWEWIAAQKEDGYRHGWVYDWSGRPIKLPENEDKAGIERKAVNYSIQCGSATIQKIAIYLCKDKDIALQVYDQLLFDGDSRIPNLSQIAPFYTPYEGHLLKRWE